MIYQMKVLLAYSKPPIWRRLHVDGSSSLSQLHWFIQISMGWTNSHLHQFIIDREYYSVPHPFDDGLDLDNHDSNQYSLEQLITTEGDKFVYEYDFGDSWTHLIEVEKIFQSEDDSFYPKCVKGRMACPPEDVGGIYGYYNFVEALNDKKHPEHEMYMDWYGDSFDTKAFDINEVNSQLERFIEETTGKAKKTKSKSKSKKQKTKEPKTNNDKRKVLTFEPAVELSYSRKQGQYLSFIFYFAKVTGYYPTQTEIARYFGVSQPAVSNMLKNLENKGWVERDSGQVSSLSVSRDNLPELE